MTMHRRTLFFASWSCQPVAFYSCGMLLDGAGGGIDLPCGHTSSVPWSLPLNNLSPSGQNASGAVYISWGGERQTSSPLIPSVTTMVYHHSLSRRLVQMPPTSNRPPDV